MKTPALSLLFSLFLLLPAAGSAASVTQLPFSYLNQYYTYSAAGASSFKINNSLYDFKDFSLSLKLDTVRALVTDNFFFAGQRIVSRVYGKDNRVLSEKNLTAEEITGQQFQAAGAGADHICLESANSFTTKRFCRDLSGTGVYSELSFEADGTRLSETGQIILNEKAEPLRFRVAYGDSYFEFITSHRNIIPSRIYKAENSSSLSVDFVDLNDPAKYSFHKQLQLSDTNFEINVDELISLYQDIVFNENLDSKEIQYEFKSWLPKKVVTYNKFGIEPIGLYSQLRAKSATIDARIISDLSKGFRTYYHNFTPQFERYYSAKILQIQIRADASGSTSISNKSTTLISLEGGNRYYRSPDFFYKLSLNLEEKLFTQVGGSGTSLDMVKALTPSAGAGADWIFSRRGNWSFSLSSGGSLIAPTTISSGSTDFSFALFAGLQASYKIRWGRFYYGAEFMNHDTRNSVFTYQYQALEHRLGFYYLF